MKDREGRMVYVVASSRDWNRGLFDRTIRHYPGRWIYVAGKEELLREAAGAEPRYIFFLHWSDMVPRELVDTRECVGFHMTDLPYGRGGSPLQNLLKRGVRKTVMTAFRMTEDVDGGPLYGNRGLSLEGGSAEELYLRASGVAAGMIKEIVEKNPEPTPQRGRVTTFRRREPEESEIPRLENIEAVHDFIRMLDAEGYPRAFLRHKGFRLEFSRSVLYDGRVLSDVKITQERQK